MPVFPYEQQYSNSCVPACMCIIQLWRGEPPTEDAFHQGAVGKGHDLCIVQSLPRVRTLAIGEGDEDEIILALGLGHFVIALLLGSPYVAWFAARHPEALSRHGRLCAPGSYGGSPHVVVITGRLDDGYRYYDPWYPVGGQPYEMGEDDFQRCFGGRIAIAEP